MSSEPVNASAPHRFLREVERSSRPRYAAEIALSLANYYGFGATHPSETGFLSRTKWKNTRRRCTWAMRENDAKGNVFWGPEKTSEPFSYKTILDSLRKHSSFRHSDFSLPAPVCDWLDSTMSATPSFHAPSTKRGQPALTWVLASPIQGYPFEPTFDREGTARLSPQRSLMANITHLRHTLLEESDRMNSDDWFEKFRALISSAISLLDNTLHQTYSKARFSPLSGWTFDEDALGQKQGRRLTDKLRWITKISGHALHLDANTRRAIERLRTIRNHLQHFDPPFFCFTFEEMAEWLNDVRGLAYILFLIRQCLRAMPSNALVSLCLLGDVTFFPKTDRPRAPQPTWSGYRSVAEQRPPAVATPRATHEVIRLTPLPREPDMRAHLDS